MAGLTSIEEVFDMRQGNFRGELAHVMESVAKARYRCGTTYRKVLFIWP